MFNFLTREIYPGEVIFSEGSKGDMAYILTEGRVEISTKIGPKKIVLAIVNPVEVFGEMAFLLKENKRTATATALENSKAIEVTKETFESYIKESPKFLSAVLNTLANRLKTTSAKVSKTPDIFLGIFEILNLLAVHNNLDILYDQTIEAISKTFLEDVKEVAEKLVVIEAFQLIELKNDPEGKRIIHISSKEDFLQRATKIHHALVKFTTKQEM